MIVVSKSETNLRTEHLNIQHRLVTPNDNMWSSWLTFLLNGTIVILLAIRNSTKLSEMEEWTFMGCNFKAPAHDSVWV